MALPTDRLFSRFGWSPLFPFHVVVELPCRRTSPLVYTDSIFQRGYLSIPLVYIISRYERYRAMTKDKESGMVKLGGCRCRCGHEWLPRGDERPTVCPKCKSPRWD